MKICKKYDKNILTKFLIYRDLRNRGYIVKDGFGFGSDFRVYERGHFGEKGAKYLIFGMNEGTQEKIIHLQKKILRNYGKIKQSSSRFMILILLKKIIYSNMMHSGQ